MADANTPNYNFTLPEVGGSDDTWGGKLNANWGALDTLLKTNFDAFKAADKMSADIGDVKMRAHGAVPAGWLECNGQAVARAGIYNPLFLIIGTIYGAGDGVSTFNVPDYRGMFLRGWDNGRGIDPGRALGSTAANHQADGMKSHTHGTGGKTGVQDTNHSHTVTVNNGGTHTHNIRTGAGSGGGSTYISRNNTFTTTTDVADAALSDGLHSHTTTVGNQSANHAHTIPATVANAVGADETRPKNMSIMYVIKY